MSHNPFLEYFILGLPYAMGAVFAVGIFLRVLIWLTVSRHNWFAREFARRVDKFVETQQPGSSKTPQSFYVLSKRLMERTYYETFALRDRMKRRRGDSMMGMTDRIFLVKPGCAWMVRDMLKQVKFIKWTNDTPKLLNMTKATFDRNPYFNRVFGLIPVAGLNDLISILPGMFVIAGILGTFIGIAGGLSELGGMNLADLENTRSIMDRFLHEISFAMKTSIFGIVFSLLSHVANVTFSPERVYSGMVERFESALDLIWYRADNNNFPSGEQPFDEHRDPVDALAEQSIDMEMTRYGHESGRESRSGTENRGAKAS